jgi:TPR repeat protein
MTDRDKLPAKTHSGQLILPKEQPGSLVARGLEALKNRHDPKPDVLLEPVDIIAKYRKAAEQGDVEAQLNLGWEYHTGDFVAKDNAEALKWWRKSAAQGCVAAQNSLGWAYK